MSSASDSLKLSGNSTGTPGSDAFFAVAKFLAGMSLLLEDRSELREKACDGCRGSYGHNAMSLCRVSSEKELRFVSFGTRNICSCGSGKKTKSHPCRGCKGGHVPQKAGIPGRWDPTAFQAAVRKWVRTGNSVQMVDPSNLKQY